MNIGDLVQDEFGNVGVVVESAIFSNGKAVRVQFGPASGYNNNEGWILEYLLEVVSEHR